MIDATVLRTASRANYLRIKEKGRREKQISTDKLVYTVNDDPFLFFVYDFIMIPYLESSN